MKTLLFPSLLALLTGCGSDEISTTGPATPSSSGPNEMVEEPTKRDPPMRKPVQCCADLKLEKAVIAYTQAGVQLTAGTLESETLSDLITKS